MHTPHTHTIIGKPRVSRGPLYVEPGWMTQVKNILGVVSHRRTGQRRRRRCQVERQARAALAEVSLLQLWVQGPSRKLGVSQLGHRKQLVAIHRGSLSAPSNRNSVQFCGRASPQVFALISSLPACPAFPSPAKF